MLWYTLFQLLFRLLLAVLVLDGHVHHHLALSVPGTDDVSDDPAYKNRHIRGGGIRKQESPMELQIVCTALPLGELAAKLTERALSVRAPPCHLPHRGRQDC